jgi:hypothetical protein
MQTTGAKTRASAFALAQDRFAEATAGVNVTTLSLSGQKCQGTGSTSFTIGKDTHGHCLKTTATTSLSQGSRRICRPDEPVQLELIADGKISW